MSYSPATIANYFITRALKEMRGVTPMQLLKLVYIAHGWHLGYTGAPLINEKVQAWRYGPVIKSLYDKVRKFGRGSVGELLHAGALPWATNAEVDENTASLLDSVWNSYARFSGLQLSEMTHQPGTPWSIAWHEQGGRDMYFAPIDDELIRKHYADKIAKARENEVVA
ncbi:Panacea domain-containing protein [Stenotrophomonas acidaminiphila]|uniref:Panacea domain-containing protein n=1 Tax=Stenotrophomonas acidaminiphila TaxID=128780 RepID=UPI003BF1B6DD